MPRPLNIQQHPSSAQSHFIRQSLTHNIRIDGRTNLTKRKPTTKLNVLPHLIGSSYIFYEYEHVEVYTGVKLKLDQVEEGREVRVEDRLVLELSAMGTITEDEQQQLGRMKALVY